MGTILTDNIAVFDDDYQLTMAQAHFLNGTHETRVVANYFFRTLPFKGGYGIFSGILDAATMINNLKFTDDQIDHLAMKSSGKYRPNFLAHLRDYKFSGDLYAASEGEVVFPHEPLVRLEGSMLDFKMIDTMVMSIINKTSAHATKTARIVHAANGKPVIDMSLRRAGFGGYNATRGALTGGAASTSNRYASYIMGIEATGTMAHDWVQSFANDLAAFRAWWPIYRDNCIFLVDTYDTLKHGVPAAIIVAKEMEAAGCKLKGIRIDSGDLAYMSKAVRAMLDEAGLQYVKIVVTNRINEYIVLSLEQQKAPIDVYGSGEAIGLCDGENLDGVFKLSVFDHQDKMKKSDNIEKQTLPGNKQTIRYASEGIFRCDGICLTDEEVNDVQTIVDPKNPRNSKDVYQYTKTRLLNKWFERGARVGKFSYPKPPLDLFPEEIKRFDYPHEYKVGVSPKLLKLRDSILDTL